MYDLNYNFMLIWERERERERERELTVDKHDIFTSLTCIWCLRILAIFFFHEN